MSSNKIDLWNRALSRIGESERVEAEQDVVDNPAAAACDIHYDDVLREVLEARHWPMFMRQAKLAEVSEQTKPYSGTGSQTQFDIPYAFVGSDQVTVVLVSSSGAETEQTAGTDYSVTAAQPGLLAYVTMAVAPAVGETLRITVSLRRYGWSYLYALPHDCVTPAALIYGDTRTVLLPHRQRLDFDVLPNDAGDGFLLACNVSSDQFDRLEYVMLFQSVRAMPAAFKSAVIYRLAAELALEIPKDRAKHNEMLSLYFAQLDLAMANQMNQGHGNEGLDTPTPYELARG